MSWLKHDLDDRCQYTAALMSAVKMPLISSSYFLENVENEEVLRSGCKCNGRKNFFFTHLILYHVVGLLYDALKMYMVEGKGREIVRSDYYSVRRNSERNRVSKNELSLLLSEKKKSAYNACFFLCLL